MTFNSEIDNMFIIEEVHSDMLFARIAFFIFSYFNDRYTPNEISNTDHLRFCNRFPIIKNIRLYLLRTMRVISGTKMGLKQYKSELHFIFSPQKHCWQTNISSVDIKCKMCPYMYIFGHVSIKLWVKMVIPSMRKTSPNSARFDINVIKLTHCLSTRTNSKRCQKKFLSAVCALDSFSIRFHVQIVYGDKSSSIGLSVKGDG